MSKAKSYYSKHLKSGKPFKQTTPTVVIPVKMIDHSDNIKRNNKPKLLKSDKFTSGLHKTSVQGFIQHSSKKEDNIVYIQNVSTYVAENYKNNKFILENPKFSTYNFKHGNENKDHNIFFGIFDGHDGKFASEFASETAVYELFSSPEYQAGNYKEALEKLFLSIHNSLLQSKHYKVDTGNESPNGIASGTCASVVLITKEWTFFASVGNSAIVVNDEKSLFHLGACHTQANEKCMKRVIKSCIPILRIHKDVTAEADDDVKETYVSIGNDLKILGSIGDSLYHVEIYNNMVQAMNDFCNDAKRNGKLEKYIEKNIIVDRFQSHLTGSLQDKYQILKTNVNFLCKNNRFYRDLLHSYTCAENSKIKKVATDPITRRGYVQSIKNSHLKGFAIFSSGVIDAKLPYSKESLIEALIFNEKRGFDSCFSECCSLSQVSIKSEEEDRSGFLCWFNFNSNVE